MAIASHQVQQAFFAKLSELVLRLRNAIAEGNKHISLRETHFFFLQNDFGKESNYQSTGFEFSCCTGIVNHEGWKVSSVRVDKLPCNAVEDSQKQRGVLFRCGAVI